MLKLPQVHTNDEKANAIMAWYLNRKILGLVQSEVKGYEDILGKEHYCKIRGQYKANEKFLEKGHVTHICRTCFHLSAAEKAEALTVNRFTELQFQHLNQSDKKWQAGKKKFIDLKHWPRRDAASAQ